jgi:flagellar protein FlaG
MAIAAVYAGSVLDSLAPAVPAVIPAPQPTAKTSDVRAQKPESARSVSPSEAPDQEALNNEIAFANSVAELFDKKVSFSYDDRIKQVVVKIIQQGTEEVIRQIPAEEMIALRLRLKENFQGIIVNQAG